MQFGHTKKYTWESAHLIWAIGSLCALHRKSFDARLLAHEFPTNTEYPADESLLIRACSSLGFRIKPIEFSARKAQKLPLPLLFEFKAADGVQLALIGLMPC
jgi:subfamily B ATP-binding cassette protein HlyB/CyaB